jgi:hypothetical protein
VVPVMGLVATAALVVVVVLVVVAFLVDFLEDFLAGALVVEVAPAVTWAPAAATAGGVVIADEVAGTWADGLSPVAGTDPVPFVVVGLRAATFTGPGACALVATPAMDATATVTARTRPTTRAERNRVEAALKRKAGRARRRSPVMRRPASVNRRKAGSRFTRRLARRGWPTGANAPSMAIVSFGRSWVGMRTRTGQPLTITSRAVAGRPSGVLPTPRTTSRPPIVSQDQSRSTLVPVVSMRVQPLGSTRRSNAA